MAKMRGPLPAGFETIDETRMPKHVAIIMDGNGRWAKQQGKMRTTGHRAGMERMVNIVRVSSDIGLDVLTLYAFSTENWKRPKLEVDTLFSLLVEYIRREIDELHRNNVRLVVMGDYQKLPSTAVMEVNRGMDMTKNNTGMVLNIALNYGSRAELVRAVQQIAKKAGENVLSWEKIDETDIQKELYTAALPDPDLLIRTSGEQRLSNYLLWQLAYSEFYFTKVPWPDFSPEELKKAVEEYSNRDRRYGGLKEEE